VKFHCDFQGHGSLNRTIVTESIRKAVNLEPSGEVSFDAPSSRLSRHPLLAGSAAIPAQAVSKRQAPSDQRKPFNMAYLAARHSACANGVAKRHGMVTRKMVQPMWADYPLDEVPIGSVTNGIHTRSWISAGMSALLNRYLGPQWHPQVWAWLSAWNKYQTT
jgi:glucan phosphorylase